MRNSVLTGISIFALAIGFVLTIYGMYATLEDGYNGYEWLGSAMISSVIILAIKEATLKIKTINYAVSSIFYLFSIVFALVTLYSSPTDKPELLAGALFFISGSLVLAVSFMTKSVESSSYNSEIGTLHKYVRYVLLLLVVVILLRIVYAVYIAARGFYLTP